MKTSVINLRYFSLFTFVLCTVCFCKTNAQVKSVSEFYEGRQSDLEKFLTADSAFVKIQLIKLPSHHLQLTAYINKVKGNFILDTGAGMTVIGKKYKERFNLQIEDTIIDAIGGGGIFGVEQSQNNIIDMEGFHKPELTVYLMDLSDINLAMQQMGEKEIDGVIGSDILSQHHAILDYTNLVLYLKK